jgi:hypothetical protein
MRINTVGLNTVVLNTVGLNTVTLNTVGLKEMVLNTVEFNNSGGHRSEESNDYLWLLVTGPRKK